MLSGSQVDIFIGVFLLSFVIFQLLGYFQYRYELLWVASDYLWLGLAAISILFLSNKANLDTAASQLPDYVGNLSQMRQAAEISVAANLQTLMVLDSRDPTDGPIGSSEYHTDIKVLQDRIQAVSAHLKNADWPERMESFFDCSQLSAGLKSSATQQSADRLCETFEFVRNSRNVQNEIRRNSERGVLSWLEVHYFPGFLALAVAVRLGRTTSDIRRKRAAQPARKAQDAGGEAAANA